MFLHRARFGGVCPRPTATAGAGVDSASTVGVMDIMRGMQDLGRGAVCGTGVVDVAGALHPAAPGLEARVAAAQAAVMHLKWLQTRYVQEQKDWEEQLTPLRRAEMVDWVSDAGRRFKERLEDLRYEAEGVIMRFDEGAIELAGAIIDAETALDRARRDRDIARQALRTAVCS